jgi:hypothetical protein
MKPARSVSAVLLLMFSAAIAVVAQQSSHTPAAPMPRLITFSGIVKAANSQAVKNIVGITFALYSEQEGGAPLWIETQSVRVNSAGHYTVELGATGAHGLPLELFDSGQARWLGVTPEGQAEQPRVLMSAVCRRPRLCLRLRLRRRETATTATLQPPTLARLHHHRPR